MCSLSPAQPRTLSAFELASTEPANRLQGLEDNVLGEMTTLAGNERSAV